MKYVALLRGVNVGGNRKVPMSDLVTCFEGAGLTNVSTYINSGNVIFESTITDEVELIQKCMVAFEKAFGFSVKMSIISVEQLRDAYEHAPDWWGHDAAVKHNAIFVIAPASGNEVAREAGGIAPEYEKIAVYDQVIFWSAPLATFGRSRWAKIVGTKAYQDITIRNANTMRKLVELVTDKKE